MERPHLPPIVAKVVFIVSICLTQSALGFIVDDQDAIPYPREPERWTFDTSLGQTANRLEGTEEGLVLLFSQSATSARLYQLNDTSQDLSLVHTFPVPGGAGTLRSVSIGNRTVALMRGNSDGFNAGVVEIFEDPSANHTWVLTASFAVDRIINREVDVSPNGDVVAFTDDVTNNFGNPEDDKLTIAFRWEGGWNVTSWTVPDAELGTFLDFNRRYTRWAYVAADTNDVAVTAGDAQMYYDTGSGNVQIHGYTVFFHRTNSSAPWELNAVHPSHLGKHGTYGVVMVNGKALVVQGGVKNGGFDTAVSPALRSFTFNSASQLWEDDFGLDAPDGEPPFKEPNALFDSGYPTATVDIYTYGRGASDSSGTSTWHGISWMGSTLAVTNSRRTTLNQFQHGTVYLFHFDGTDWKTVKRILPNSLTGGDRFGAAVGVVNGHVVISSLSDDKLYVADAYCGNGMVDALTGEACDDGNLDSGDGCDALCVVEFCGDGLVNNGEECDDGAVAAGDGCSASCVTEFCGDGVVNNVNETCDDGGIVDGDRCSADCQIEDFCGDGAVNGNGTETCDLGLGEDGFTAKDDVTCKNCTLTCEYTCDSPERQECSVERLAELVNGTLTEDLTGECVCSEGFFGGDGCSESLGAYVASTVIVGVSATSVLVGIGLAGTQAVVVPALAKEAEAAGTKAGKKSTIKVPLAPVKKLRYNRANILAIVSVFTEFLQLLTFAFDPAIPWRGAGTDDMGSYLAVTQLQFVGSLTAVFPDATWDNVFWVVLVASLVYVCYGVFIVVKLQNGMPVVTAGFVRNNAFLNKLCSVNLPILTILGGPGLLPVMRNMMAVLDCSGPNDEFPVPTLDVDPDVTCWEGDHLRLAGWALVAFALYFPLLVKIQPTIQDYNLALDVKWQAGYIRALLATKIGLALLAVFFGSSPISGYLIALGVVVAGLVLAAMALESFSGRVCSLKWLQRFRSVGFGLVVWSGLCGIAFTYAASAFPDGDNSQFASSNVSWALALTWWGVTLSAMGYLLIRYRQAVKAARRALSELGFSPNEGSKFAAPMQKEIAAIRKDMVKSGAVENFSKAEELKIESDRLIGVLKEITDLETAAATRAGCEVAKLPEQELAVIQKKYDERKEETAVTPAVPAPPSGDVDSPTTGEAPEVPKEADDVPPAVPPAPATEVE